MLGKAFIAIGKPGDAERPLIIVLKSMVIDFRSWSADGGELPVCVLHQLSSVGIVENGSSRNPTGRALKHARAVERASNSSALRHNVP